MPAVTFSGLSSGFDTDGIVTQLMALERQGRRKIEFRQTNVQARTDNLGEVNTKLNALKTAAQDMRIGSIWTPKQTVEVGDPTKMAATLTGGAGVGGTSVNVLSLASSSQRTYTYTAPGATETWNFGASSVDIAAGATLDDAVTAINGTSGIGVVAVNAGGKLVVSSTTTGVASAFAWSATSLAQDSEKLGTDASYRINGGAIETSSTNTLGPLAIPGVSVTLKGVTSGDVGITVSAPAVDKDQVVAKMKAFVDAYNAVNDTIRTLTTDKKVTNPTSSTEARKGSLYGDSGLRTIQSQLRLATTEAVAGLSNTALDQLTELGISTGSASPTTSADALAGKLTFNEATFRAALDSSPTDVRAFMGGVSGTNGIAHVFEGIAGTYTQTGTGLSSRRSEADADIARLTGTLKRFDERLEAKEARLRAQFQVMESLLAQQNANGAALTNALSSLQKK